MFIYNEFRVPTIREVCPKFSTIGEKLIGANFTLEGRPCIHIYIAWPRAKRLVDKNKILNLFSEKDLRHPAKNPQINLDILAKTLYIF